MRTKVKNFYGKQRGKAGEVEKSKRGGNPAVRKGGECGFTGGPKKKKLLNSPEGWGDE